MGFEFFFGWIRMDWWKTQRVLNHAHSFCFHQGRASAEAIFYLPDFFIADAVSPTVFGPSLTDRSCSLGHGFFPACRNDGRIQGHFRLMGNLRKSTCGPQSRSGFPFPGQLLHHLQFGLHALERGSSRNFFSDSVFWGRVCLDQPFGRSFWWSWEPGVDSVAAGKWINRLEWNEPLERSGQVWVAALGNGLAHVHLDSSFL